MAKDPAFTKKSTRFQKGNKAALGSKTNGAPRTVIPSDEELDKLGQEMVKWVEDNEPLHLSYWYSIEKMITSDQFKCYKANSVFFPYYEKAQRLISKHYLNGTIGAPIAQRFLRVYFSDLRDEEDGTLDRRSQRELEMKKQLIDYEILKKSEAGMNVPPDMLDKFVTVMASLKDAQTQKD